MDEDRLYTRVGAGVIALLLLAVAAVSALGDVSLHEKVRVKVFFSHVGGLKEGADVQVAGRVIGEIKAIEFANTGGIVAHAVIEQRYAHMAPINGDWFVNSKGIIGERYLEVGPPADGGEWARTVQDGDELQGITPPELDRLAAISLSNITTMRVLAREILPEARQLARELDNMAKILDDLQPKPGAFKRSYDAQVLLVDEAKKSGEYWGNTGVAMDNVRATQRKASALLARAGDEIGRVRARMDILEREIQRVRGAVDPARLEQFQVAIDESRRAMKKAEEGMRVAAELTQMIELGQGTIGGFAQDHEIRDAAKQMQRTIKRTGWEILGHPDMRNGFAPKGAKRGAKRRPE